MSLTISNICMYVLKEIIIFTRKEGYFYQNVIKKKYEGLDFNIWVSKMHF